MFITITKQLCLQCGISVPLLPVCGVFLRCSQRHGWNVREGPPQHPRPHIRSTRDPGQGGQQHVGSLNRQVGECFDLAICYGASSCGRKLGAGNNNWQVGFVMVVSRGHIIHRQPEPPTVSRRPPSTIQKPPPINDHASIIHIKSTNTHIDHRPSNTRLKLLQLRVYPYTPIWSVPPGNQLCTCSAPLTANTTIAS